MSTPQANYSQQQPRSSQGIPLWLGALIVGAVVLAGGTFLTMQFLKEAPKSPTSRITGRPKPGEPGGGPGGAGGPGMPTPTGNSEPAKNP